jgi:hypothetical protein
MTVQRFYRLSLLLPLLLPLPFLATGSTASSALGMLLAFSLVYGGIPYAILACGLLFWLHDRDEHEINIMLFLAPWLMMPLQILCVSVAALLPTSTGSTIWEAFSMGLAFGLYLCFFVFCFGYVYAALTQVLLWLLRRCGVVEPRRDS